jgi:RNA ligase
MNNITTAQAIANRIAQGDRNFGRVAIKEQGDYVLLNYTNEALFSGDFTAVESVCRGLIVRKDGHVMALPMEKFYNLGEPQCPSLPDEPYTVWEKIDGSLGIFWHDDTSWRCSTRGSFQNDYIDFALNWWRQNVGTTGIPDHWTVMVEICIDSDEMPRAAYKPEGLYLLAVRDRHSGTDISLDLVNTTGLPKAERVHATIDQLLKRRQQMEGQEGWVVRFSSGFRVKIKTIWYLRVFRAMQSMTPRRIRELMIEAGEDWIDTFPDDLRAEAVAIQEAIETQYQNELAQIRSAYSRVEGIESRKDYAIKVLADHPGISTWLFRLRDGKFNELDVLRKLDLVTAGSFLTSHKDT